MELAKHLIAFCDEKLEVFWEFVGGPDATEEEIANGEALDEKVWHCIYRQGWKGFAGQLDHSLAKLDLETFQPIPCNHHWIKEEYTKKLAAIQALADGDSLDALFELFRLAKWIALAVQKYERVQYVADHPWPWQGKGNDAKPEARPQSHATQVDDEETRKMLGKVEKEIIEREQRREKRAKDWGLEKP